MPVDNRMMDHNPQTPSDGERLARLCLARTETVGPITYRALLARFGSAEAALRALPDLARRGGRAAVLKPPSPATAQAEIDGIARLGGRVVTLPDPFYPHPLAAVEDAPPVLFVLGQADLLHRPAIALVGARNASTNGRRMAKDLAAGLGAAGYVVVSGLARGIDTAAHIGATATGTVAVLAGGVDIVYPPENAELHARLAEAGTLVSEFPCGTEPQARHFPRRNRVISGLSLGVVVVEAARRSGSLITARLAAEQGREVFAVPGSPLDPRAHGANDLIRKGAVLVQGVDDVLSELAGQTPALAEGRRAGFMQPPDGSGGDEAALTAARARVLEGLSPTPCDVDELIRDSQLSAAVVWTVLLDLELAGRIERQPGNRVALI